MISDSGLIVISWIVISGTVITMPRNVFHSEQRHVDRSRERAVPDFPALHEELYRHRLLALQLVREESALCISGGAGNRMWRCARSTNPVRRVSLTRPVPRFRYTIRLPATSGQRRCS
jgi:hypothetical protein